MPSFARQAARSIVAAEVLVAEGDVALQNGMLGHGALLSTLSRPIVSLITYTSVKDKDRAACTKPSPRLYSLSMVKLGKYLAALRDAEGISYRTLAERVGISYNALSAYEKDREMPSFENVVKLSRYFKVPIEYFISGEEKPFEYHDLDLVELFKQVDGLDEAFRSLVKSFAGRVVAHAQEEQTLTKTAAEPLGPARKGAKTKKAIA